jgi:DNA processing protein
VQRLLDPADRAPAARAEASAWLAFQEAFAFRPSAAAALLAEGREAALSSYRGADRGALLDRLAARGVRGVPLGAAEYPPRLARLSDPAPLLWVTGDLAVLRAPAVAIVGSRAPSGYGLVVARSLARALASAGLAVVSGLARGIDAAAHEGALEAGGATVAFQACGPDLVYPAAHRRLAGRIAEAGAVVSELPPGMPPRAPHFPLRNRLISGSSLAVVAVEARERSGTLVTVRHAAEQGVEVLAVPGPIDAPTSRGTNRLLRDGARLLLDVRDVLEAIGVEVAIAPPAERERVRREVGEPGDAVRLSPLARAVLAALVETPATRDALGRRLAHPPEVLAPALLELELAGRVAEERDGRLRAVGDPFRRKAGREPEATGRFRDG